MKKFSSFILSILFSINALAIGGGFGVSRTQQAIQTPFNNATNGFLAQEVQTAIEEAQKTLAYRRIAFVGTTAITSTSDVVMAGVNFTLAGGNRLAKGIYLIGFSTDVQSNAAGAAISFSFYVGGVQSSGFPLKEVPLDGGLGSVGTGRSMISFYDILTVDGTQDVEVKWSVSSGTATASNRIMTSVQAGVLP